MGETEVTMAVNTLLRNGEDFVLTVCSSIKQRVEILVCLRNSYVTKNSRLIRDGLTMFSQDKQNVTNGEKKNQKNSEELPDKNSDPNAGLPKNPKDFKPIIPKWPTPTGKTEADVRKHCEAKIKETDTYKSCHRVLGGRFSIKGAVEQCMVDTLLTD